MIPKALTETDLAAVVSTSGSSSGVTRDHARLQDAIMKLTLHNPFRHVARTCPDMDYSEADRIQNKHDIMAIDTAIEDTLACCKCTRSSAEALVDEASRETLQIGDQDVSVSLGLIRELVRKMGFMPGQGSLILLSPGF